MFQKDTDNRLARKLELENKLKEIEIAKKRLFEENDTKFSQGVFERLNAINTLIGDINAELKSLNL